MYQEALGAIRKGEKARARDLFTRLLKANPNRTDYWLWMSSLVETVRERAYCLKEASRLEPDNPLVRRGMTLLGMQPVDQALVVPPEQQHRRWDDQLISGPSPEKLMKAGAGRRVAMFAGLGVVALALIVLGVIGTRRAVVPLFARNVPIITAGPTPTYLPTPSPVGQAAAQEKITPLAMTLKATYTPTPLVVNTPHSISEAYRIAMRAYERGDWQAVVNNMQQVLSVEPGALDVYYYLGEAYRQMGDTNQALDAYGQALNKDPEFAPALLGLGRLLAAGDSKRWDEAQKDLETALEKDANLYEASLELSALDLRRNRAESALTRLEEAPAAAQSSPLFYYYRAQAYLALDDPDPAVEAARQANTMDLTYLPGYRLLAQALLAAGTPEEAVPTLEVYTRYQADDATAWAWLGRAYSVNGEQQKAVEAFNRALKLDRNQFDALLYRGQSYLDLSEGDKALQDLDAAVKQRSDSFEANIGLGRAQLMVGANGNAYMTFARAEAFAKSSAQRGEMLYWRAQSLELVNQIAPAINDWRALLALPPEGIPLGWLEMARQRLAELITPTAGPSPTSTLTPTAGTPAATATLTPIP